MRQFLVLLLIVFSGCSQTASLQPDVAAYGSYAVMEGRRRPAPPPAPTDGCAAGCKCNGTGREPTGDGLSDSECRCPDGCDCKKKAAPAAMAPVKAPICTTGTCAGWPPKSTAR